MELIGKSAPTEQQLQDTSQSFDACELYLTTNHLDRFEETVAVCSNAAVEVSVVHTPHVSLEDASYLIEAARLVDRLDAVLVVHTSRIGLEQTIAYVERHLSADIDYGYEHQHPSEELPSIRKHVLSQNHNVVLDTAHLYLASSSTEDYQNQLQLIVDNHGSAVAVVHLNDASRKEDDNLGVGDGEMPLKWSVEQLTAIAAPVTVEVARSKQGEGKRRVEAMLE